MGTQTPPYFESDCMAEKKKWWFGMLEVGEMRGRLAGELRLKQAAPPPLTPIHAHTHSHSPMCCVWFTCCLQLSRQTACRCSLRTFVASLRRRVIPQSTSHKLATTHCRRYREKEEEEKEGHALLTHSHSLTFTHSLTHSLTHIYTHARLNVATSLLAW